MPLIVKKKKDKFSFAVWQVHEDLSFFLDKLSLCEPEKEEIANFNHKRKLEWVTTRYLLYILEDKKKRSCCLKDKKGKPYLQNSKYHISLSHSGEYVAAIIANSKVGIDIQQITDKVDLIKTKFLSSNEIVQCEKSIDKMNRYWTAKEAMYKAYGKKGLKFAEEIKVCLFNKKNKWFLGNGTINKKNKSFDYLLLSKNIDKTILTIAIKK